MAVLRKRSFMQHQQLDHYDYDDHDSHSRSALTVGAVGVGLVLLGGAAYLAYRAFNQAKAKSSAAHGIERVLAMNATMHDLYEVFRHPERLTAAMPFIERIRMDGEESVWAAKLGDKPLEWRMRLEEDRPSEGLVWSSLPDSPLKLRLKIELEPLPTGRGNAVRMTLDTDTVAQSLLGPVAKRVVQEILLKTRALLEAGEVPTTKGQPHGGKASKKDHQDQHARIDQPMERSTGPSSQPSGATA
jgi:uncharacterized membrane protein